MRPEPQRSGSLHLRRISFTVGLPEWHNRGQGIPLREFYPFRFQPHD